MPTIKAYDGTGDPSWYGNIRHSFIKFLCKNLLEGRWVDQKRMAVDHKNHG
ncbi:MAG: hypothetical protein Q8829_02595 [Candidatus Phytoplasma australasiaticum]|nr:hypothetical protein [Candidatus Phytoplasma australasiaticum]